MSRKSFPCPFGANRGISQWSNIPAIHMPGPLKYIRRNEKIETGDGSPKRCLARLATMMLCHTYCVWLFFLSRSQSLMSIIVFEFLEMVLLNSFPRFLGAKAQITIYRYTTVYEESKLFFGMPDFFLSRGVRLESVSFNEGWRYKYSKSLTAAVEAGLVTVCFHRCWNAFAVSMQLILLASRNHVLADTCRKTYFKLHRKQSRAELHACAHPWNQLACRKSNAF